MGFKCVQVNYSGDGTESRDIGCGFDETPKAVFIHHATGSNMAYKFWGPTVEESKVVTSTTTFTNQGILGMTAGTFSVGKFGGVSTVNNSGVNYRAISMWGDDESFAVGEYTGVSSEDNRNIQVGFRPDWIILVEVDGTDRFGRCWNSSKGGDNTQSWTNSGGTWGTDQIQGTHSNGFTVGTVLNGEGVPYKWIAWANAADTVEIGSYVGDGTQDRVVTAAHIGVESIDRYMIVKGEESSASFAIHSTPDDHPSSHRLNNSWGDDMITLFGTNAFTVDDNAFSVNLDGKTYYYLAVQTGDGITSFGTAFGGTPEIEPMQWEYFSYYFDEYQQFKGNNSLSQRFRRIKL